MTVLIVSPVFNEADHLERTARAIAAQTRPPDRWVIVDDGSRDDDARDRPPAGRRARLHDGDRLRRRATSPAPTSSPKRARRAPSTSASRTPAGGDYDFIGKLDGDVELPPRVVRHPARPLRRRPAARPRRRPPDRADAAAAGTGSRSPPTTSTAPSSSSAASAWRRSAASPSASAGTRSTRPTPACAATRRVTFDDLVARHHRPWGSADGRLRGRARHGECAWILHYDPLWVTLRSVKVGRSSPAGRLRRRLPLRLRARRGARRAAGRGSRVPPLHPRRAARPDAGDAGRRARQSDRVRTEDRRPPGRCFPSGPGR